jgi:hypothetical protein
MTALRMSGSETLGKRVTLRASPQKTPRAMTSSQKGKLRPSLSSVALKRTSTTTFPIPARRMVYSFWNPASCSSIADYRTFEPAPCKKRGHPNNLPDLGWKQRGKSQWRELLWCVSNSKRGVPSARPGESGTRLVEVYMVYTRGVEVGVCGCQSDLKKQMAENQ